ncbi:MAG: hypothetical protein GXP62_00135, partial [Oligoflexia bacterium]|nr:hypothetical protein [Oligoflexia bacterium]
MLPIHNTASLCPGDVLIHPTRGAGIVDQILVAEPTDDAADAQVCVELTERRDPGPATLSADDLSDGWHLAAPGGLFERSVLHPDEASAQVAENPGDALCMLADELGSPIDQEQASTWL